MASPQVENGYTRIANELLEALAHIRVPGEAMQVYIVILRKTYGYGKKEDAISLSQFCLATGLNKPHVCAALSKLRAMNLITEKSNEKDKKYQINKDFDTWKALPKKVTLPKKVKNITEKGNKPLPFSGTSKEIYRKKEKGPAAHTSLLKDISPEERESIGVLQSIPGYPLDLDKDLPFLQEKSIEYPDIDFVALLRDWKTYLIDHPLTKKCSPRSQLGNQFKLARKWGKHLKSTPTSIPGISAPDTSALERIKAMEREMQEADQGGVFGHA